MFARDNEKDPNWITALVYILEKKNAFIKSENNSLNSSVKWLWHIAMDCRYVHTYVFLLHKEAKVQIQAKAKKGFCKVPFKKQTLYCEFIHGYLYSWTNRPQSPDKHATPSKESPSATLW